MHRERRPGFRWWLGATALSVLGDSVTFFALGWVAAAHGAGAASLVLTVESVPLCLLILVGGAAADRFGIRRVVALCDAGMAVVMLAFAAGSLLGTPLWALVLVALLSGTFAALRRPAAGVFPRLFASDEELPRTMATVGLCLELARIAGPGVGGFLLAFGGLSVTSVLDAASFVLVLVVVLRVRPPREPEPATPSGEPAWRQVTDAARRVRQVPGAVPTLWAVAGLAVSVLPLVSLCVPLAGHAREWGAGGTGLVAAAWTVGGLAVTATVALWGKPGRRPATAGPALAGAGTLALAVTDGLVAGAAAMVLVGIGTSLATARLFPQFVERTPAGMLARFQSLLGLAQTGPMLVATPLLGRLAGHAGVASALVLLAGVLLLTALAVRRADAAGTATSTEAVPAASGPVHPG